LGRETRVGLFGRVLAATGLSETATGVFDVAAFNSTSSAGGRVAARTSRRERIRVVATT